MPLPAIAIGAKLLGARKALKRVPRKVWITLAVVAAVVLAGWLAHRWHAGKVEAFGNERYAAGYAQARGEIEALRQQINRRNAELAAALRSKHDEQIRRNSADADALRLRGPGRAACASAFYIPAAAGRHDGAGRPADAAVGDVRSEQREPLVGLPFAPTVAFAEQHDNFRTEALSWRAWHFQFTTEWEKWRAKAGQ